MAHALGTPLNLTFSQLLNCTNHISPPQRLCIYESLPAMLFFNRSWHLHILPACMSLLLTTLSAVSTSPNSFHLRPLWGVFVVVLET